MKYPEQAGEVEMTTFAAETEPKDEGRTAAEMAGRDMRDLIEDPKVAERIAYAVKTLQEVGMRVQQESKNVFAHLIEESGIESVTAESLASSDHVPDEVWHSIWEKKHNFSELSVARNLGSTGRFYQERARNQADILHSMHEVIQSLESRGAPALLERAQMVREVLDGYIDGYQALLSESSVGRLYSRVGEPLAEFFGQQAEKLSDTADALGWHLKEYIGDVQYNTQSTFENIGDAAVNTARDIKWKLFHRL